MLHSRHIDYLNICRVTFEVPAAELPEDGPVASLVVVGDFNDWDASATPMHYNETKKAYQAAVKLEPGRAYQYRYLLNGRRWFNDPQADHYVRGPFGQPNCVLVTPASPSLNGQTGQ